MYYSVVQAMNISYWKNTNIINISKLLMICSSVNQYILTINANLLKHACIHSTYLKTFHVHIISTLKKENLWFIAENNYFTLNHFAVWDLDGVYVEFLWLYILNVASSNPLFHT